MAVDGEQGAKRILDILRKDFELAMRLRLHLGLRDKEGPGWLGTHKNNSCSRLLTI